MIVPLLILGSTLGFSEALFEQVFGNPESQRQTSLVLVDCESGDRQTFGSDLAEHPLPPCSTFKIWNTALGLETGIIKSPDQAFYTWDGIKRSIDGWNRNLTLRESFAESCVPAFQALTRKIGNERMTAWIEKLGYGNRDTSAGPDVFWLPAQDRSTILISAKEQADLLAKLARSEIPISQDTRDKLLEIMSVKRTPVGHLLGKTGTGGAGPQTPPVGWYIGIIESGGRQMAFACVLTGEGASGPSARELCMQFFSASGVL